MIKVFIVDDHAVVRMGLKATLPMEGDIAIAGEAATGDGAAEAFLASDADVCLLDIRLPGKDGIAVLKEIVSARRNAKVMMLTTSEADNDVYEALNEGARGYVLKDRDADDILKAIRLVAGGAKYIPDAVRELYRERQLVPDPSPKEKEVLDLLATGLSNEQIAVRMGISVDGVKMHIKHLLVKFDAISRTHLASIALKRGFVK